jgi:hypothetical protein
MELVIRRIGNSLGVILPRTLLDAWGLGEGARLLAGPDGVRPPRASRNAQAVLDQIKRAIALEVVRRFSPAEVRKASLENLARWKAAGAWSEAYGEWREILRSGDDGELFKAMLGTDERANRLRQSMPYAGMLPRDVVTRLNEEAAR